MIKIVIAGAAIAAAFAAPAFAVGKGRALNDQVEGFYSGVDSRTPSQNGSTTMGDAVQGGFYGNAANPRPSGHGTLPSQSPGPKVNNPADPDNPSDGSSWGDIKGNGNGKAGFNASNCHTLGC